MLGIALGSASIDLESFDSMLRPGSEVQSLDGSLGIVQPYVDPTLAPMCESSRVV